MTRGYTVLEPVFLGSNPSTTICWLFHFDKLLHFSVSQFPYPGLLLVPTLYIPPLSHTEVNHICLQLIEIWIVSVSLGCHTHNHKLGALKQQKFTLSDLKTKSQKSRCQQGEFLLEALEENPFHSFPLVSGGCS